MKRLKLLVGLVSIGALIFGASLVQAQSGATAGAAQQQGQNQTAYGNYSAPRAGATAVSGQQQGQSQSSAGGAVLNSGNSGVAFNNSFNGSEQLRQLPIPTSATVDTRGGPAMFSRPDTTSRGPNFLSMSNLVGVLNHIDLDRAEIKDEGDIQMVVQLLNALDDEGLLEADLDEGAPRFMLNADPDVMRTAGDNFRPLAILSLKAKDAKTMNSATLAIKVAKFAKSIGANKIVLVQEGVTRKLSSFGVGIGLAYNNASVSSGRDGSGSVGSGGTGWSWGEAQYFELPFMTAVVGR